MAFRKHIFDEYDSLDSVCKPTKSVKVHGIITSLSPMKGNKYLLYSRQHYLNEARAVRFYSAEGTSHPAQPEAASRIGELCHP